MTVDKEQLDRMLYTTDHYCPAIICGPAHLIEQFEGYGQPEDGYYRGVLVRRQPGLGDDLYVVALEDAFEV